MTKKSFIAHSEMTNEIYIVCGTEKYLVTEQVIKAMQSTGRLEDCVSKSDVRKIAKEMYLEVANMDLDVHTISDCISYTSSKCRQVLEDKLQALPPVTPTFPKGATNGDMMKNTFPNVPVKIFEDMNTVIFGNAQFDLDWWDAPYKGVNDVSN